MYFKNNRVDHYVVCVPSYNFRLLYRSFPHWDKLKTFDNAYYSYYKHRVEQDLVKLDTDKDPVRMICLSKTSSYSLWFIDGTYIRHIIHSDGKEEYFIHNLISHNEVFSFYYPLADASFNFHRKLKITRGNVGNYVLIKGIRSYIGPLMNFPIYEQDKRNGG